MSSSHPSSATLSAQSYYNSHSTNAFYSLLWGGEDIHIGIYDPPSLTIAEAGQGTTKKRVSTVVASGLQITSKSRILDLGSRYGAPARHLAKTFRCKVVCLNLSSVQNARNEELTREAGLESLVQVVEGNFEEIPAEVLAGGKFDVVWSQDSFLHSSNRSRIIDEIARCLVDSTGGRVVFTDIMASPQAFVEQPEIMSAMLRRLETESMATRDFYDKGFVERDFVSLGYWNGKEHLKIHYRKVSELLQRRREEFVEKGVDEETIEK
ncbi:MAG: hypothetical protein LQ350_007969 [Teloschistes chrysophthalmus]|nr:MAG: hypothetical protein LQ350_007969 [Niorma chrysophthalma]